MAFNYKFKMKLSVLTFALSYAFNCGSLQKLLCVYIQSVQLLSEGGFKKLTTNFKKVR